MSSVKAIASKILSNAGYILYGSVAYAWKQPWDDAAAKGRIPIKPEVSNVRYTLMEAHNLKDYDRKFLEKIRGLSWDKGLNKMRPRKEPSVFVYPLFQKTEKEGVIPEHKITVKKWVFFSGTEAVPAQKIKVPYYRLMTLGEVLAKGGTHQAWCAQITLPARHGKKAVESGSSETRAHCIVLTIIGTNALCMELANLSNADLAALYHELFPYWYDYEQPTGEGKTQVVVVTEKELNKAFEKVAKQMQDPEALYSGPVRPF
ncbi:hypothetical protein KY338_04510 [Candidatus Woesearchaeota archaeon]|nr:hypothetical protein [Candidatus Woesearchaeota archaeon]MBW3005759.1 hypothetical protein [Candidatus Woesearchaeota archaeon]